MMPVDTYLNYPMSERPADNLSMLHRDQLPETLSALLRTAHNIDNNSNNIRNTAKNNPVKNIVHSITVGLSHLHIVGSSNTASVRLRVQKDPYSP